MINIKECDRIKDKNGKYGTVMLVFYKDDKIIGLEVEFDDEAPETRSIEIGDVLEVIKMNNN